MDDPRIFRAPRCGESSGEQLEGPATLDARKAVVDSVTQLIVDVLPAAAPDLAAK